MASSQLAKKVDEKKGPLDHIQNMLNLTEKQFSLALADTIDTGKFMRVAFNEIRRNPDLQKVSWPSLAGALMASAQLGLEPGGPLGHTYLIPYKDECTLIIGYKGMEQLAYRSGLVSSITARVVREGDTFDFEFGSNEYIRHLPSAGVGGEVTHAYAIARLVTGGQVMVVLFKEDIERRRLRSAAQKADRPSGPWSTDYDEMARKSAVRALFRDLPASTETQRALGYDEHTGRELKEQIDLGEPGEGEIIDVEASE